MTIPSNPIGRRKMNNVGANNNTRTNEIITMIGTAEDVFIYQTNESFKGVKTLNELSVSGFTTPGAETVTWEFCGISS